MRSLSATTLLQLWETGRALQPLERAVLLASEALPDQSAEAVRGLPIGSRDAAILRLRAAHHGDRLEGRTNCGECGMELEFDLSIQALLETNASSASGVDTRFRLPSSKDLAEVLSRGDASAQALAAQCSQGEGASAADGTALAVFIADHDPLADIRLQMSCAECAHEWYEVLDPPSFFWAEIESQGWRLLDEVSRLAAAFGWSETAILALTETRRRAYLELIS